MLADDVLAARVAWGRPGRARTGLESAIEHVREALDVDVAREAVFGETKAGIVVSGVDFVVGHVVGGGGFVGCDLIFFGGGVS